MTDICGLTSCEPFAKWDHDSQSWKTSEATCLWALTLSSLTLPQWGGLHDGELCEHPTPVLATSVPDYSSLPTPAAMLGASDVDFQVSGDGRTKPNKLGWAIGAMLPTPVAAEAKARFNTGGNPMLNEVIANLLPTPAVNDMGEGKTLEWWDEWAPRQKAADGRPAPHGRSLAIEAQRLLPTPATANSKSTRAMTASTENGRRSGGGQSSPPGLEEMASIMSGHWPDHMPPVDQLPPATVALLPTPEASDGTGGRTSTKMGGKRPSGAKRAITLATAIQHGATTAPPLSDGSASLDDQPHRQLSLDELALPA